MMVQSRFHKDDDGDLHDKYCALAQGAQKITEGDCPRIGRNGLHQLPRRAVLGILR
jgi:hypothetical protein